MIHETDVDLRVGDVQALSDADAIAALFSRLGYDTNTRIEHTPESLSITQEATVRSIRRIERIANQEGLLQVYLFEFETITIANTRSVARAFRDLPGNYLLVLAPKEYERIDFVLIERQLPSNGSGASKLPTPRTVRVRPRILTADRRNPTRIQLRVLRRLTWTEPDAFAQHDKIASAYTIADWSEDYFNNRALFSDYFLLERVPELPEWKDDPREAYAEFLRLYRGARHRFSGASRESLRSEVS